MLPMSAARSSFGMLTIGRIAYRREGGDGSRECTARAKCNLPLPCVGQVFDTVSGDMYCTAIFSYHLGLMLLQLLGLFPEFFSLVGCPRRERLKIIERGFYGPYVPSCPSSNSVKALKENLHEKNTFCDA